MTFVSYEFGLFLISSLILYWGTCRFFVRWRIGLLALISGLFLWFAGGLRSVIWYGVSAVSVWAGAMEIGRRREERPGFVRGIFFGTLIFNLFLLAVFRYVNFPGYTGEEISWLLGREWEWTPVFVTAPVAISFYTLTLGGYLIEVYWGTVQPERNLLKLALFGGFFPQMAVGPVARYGRLSGTLFEGNKFSCSRNLRLGFMQVVWGLFKKLVISERLAVLVNVVYEDRETYGGAFLVLAAVCFAFQLYTDFGGAVDMAAGTARMFGVELENNFCRPFFSRSLSEFWRRWHMTLGGWFKDFVLYPLLKTKVFQKLGSLSRSRFGKRQGKKIPTAAGLFLVWFLLGLWHGGKWTFIIGSGLYHAVLMSVALITEPLTKKFYQKTKLNPNNPFWIAFQRLRTFVLVAIGFVFFRSDSLAMAADIFAGMFSGSETVFNLEGVLSLGLSVADLIVLVLAMILLASVSVREEYMTESGKQHRESSDIERQGVGWCLCLAFLVLIFGYYGRGYDPSAFIYAQF